MTLKNIILSVCGLLLATNLAGPDFMRAERGPMTSPGYEATLRSIDARFRELGPGAAFLTAANRDYAAAIRYVRGAEWRALARPSWSANYVIYLLARAETAAGSLLAEGVLTGRFRHYEFRHYEQALKRGFGICSQNALGLSDLLSVRYGVDTQLVMLDGHVVLQARTPEGRFILLDPSLGLSFDFDAATAPSRLNEIVRAYRAIDPHLSTIAQAYDASGNRTITGDHGARDSWPSMYLAETLLEWMKWGLPAILALAVLLRPRRRTATMRG